MQFLFWDWTWPLWLLILVTTALGAVVWIGPRDPAPAPAAQERREARRD